MTAARQQGFSSLRYEFGVYPRAEQAESLVEQCAMVRTLQNALLAICEQRYLRKLGSDTDLLAARLAKIDADARAALEREVAAAVAHVPHLLHPGAQDDPEAFALPRAAEMNRWVTDLRRHDPRWAALSTHTPRRVVATVERAWEAFFRNLKTRPEVAGRPRRKRQDDLWLPHIHIKRAGDIGSAGSGCELEHVAGRNWRLTLRGIDGPIHVRGQMPDGDLRLFSLMQRGRFIDADVRLVAGKWKLSICAHVRRERRHGTMHLDVELGLIDGFARVNGRLETPEGILRAQAMQDEVDALKADRDQRWPHRSPSDSVWREVNAAVTRLSSRLARVRRDALHVWTTRLVAEAASITVRVPQVREVTRSPRGDKKQWGANVATVSAINRHALSQAPGMVAQMLEYKSAEAGIECEIVRHNVAEIAIGSELVKAGRATRRLARQARRA